MKLSLRNGYLDEQTNCPKFEGQHLQLLLHLCRVTTY